MKYPKSPSRPYAPYKPQPPAKQIEHKNPIGSLSSQEDSEFSLQSFEELIKAQAPGVDPSTVRFTWEIEKEYGYYDDVTISLNLKLYTASLIDNPNYKKLFSYYEEQLKKYETDYQKYKTDLKQYQIDEKKYKKELELYTLEHAKATVKRLESKTKKVKK
jgi:hypothetical protein